MRKGDVVLIPFPFTDLSGNKNRPAVILISTYLDITVSFITSQTKWKEKYDVELKPTKTNGLKIKSLIRLNKLATINKDLVIGKLGQLEEADITRLNENLVGLFKI
jgi:mRNA interferase MazF